MEPINAGQVEGNPEKFAKHEPPDTTAKEEKSSLCPKSYPQQCTPDEGGMRTDIYCQICGGEISGSYLTIFKCPHCKVQIWRDDKNNVNIPVSVGP